MYFDSLLQIVNHVREPYRSMRRWISIIDKNLFATGNVFQSFNSDASESKDRMIDSSKSGVGIETVIGLVGKWGRVGLNVTEMLRDIHRVGGSSGQVPVCVDHVV